MYNTVENRFRGLLIAILLFPIIVFAQDRPVLSQADSLQERGTELYAEGQYEDAITLFEEAARIRRELLGDCSAALSNSLFNIGLCYFNLDDCAKSLDYHQQALAIREKVHGKEHPDYASSLISIGNCYNNLGDYAKALEYYQQASAIREKVHGKEHPDYASSLNNIGLCYSNLGDDAKALDYHQQALAIREKVYGKEHPDCAASLASIGLCYNNIGDYAKALDFYKQASAIREKAYGKEGPDYAASLANIGVCYNNLGDYAKALEYYQQTLAIREKVNGKDHPDYAGSLVSIGNCYYNLGNNAKALEYYQQALAIREKVYGDEYPEYARSLNNIGNCYSGLGNYAKALEYYQRALTIREKVNGKDHPDYAMSLDNIGNCYSGLGDYAMALEYYRQALAIREKVYGKNHPDYAMSLNNIGNCYSDLGNNAKALDCHQQALAIREKTIGKEHPDYAASLTSIGLCYNNLGDNAKAQEYYQQALAIREKVYGKNHPDYAMSLNNIGNSYSDLGDYAKALDYHQQALAIREKAIGKEHPDYAMSLNNIGNCYSDLGDYAKALDYHQQALAIREKVCGKEHPDYAMSLNNVGICYSDLGNNTKALDYHQQALVIREEVYGKEHPDYAASLANIGVCYYNLGDYTKALKCYQQALAILEKVYGKGHPDNTKSLNNIGLCYYKLGDYAKATEYLARYSNAVISVVTATFSSLTESQRESFWKRYSYFFTNELFDYCTSISSPEMNRTAFDGALFGKGLLLNAELEFRNLIRESGDSEALKMYNDIQQSRIRLDDIYQDPVGKKAQIDSLNNDIETRQQELMKRSKVFGDYTRNLALKWTDVQSALGRRDIAIEFETYTHKDTTFYIALTLKRDYAEPHLIELFNSKDLGAVRPSRYYTTTSLTDLVWGPLEKELNSVQNVYFSPAGELNNIGIEYLLDKDGELILSDKRNYYRLTSTRELVKEQGSKMITDATIYGGIQYDRSSAGALTGTHGRWKYLPGTKTEAESISNTLTSMRVQNELVEGELGTEESFKNLSGKKKNVIHIATHGFYWTETEAARNKMEAASFMLEGESRAPKEDKALTRSGLLFAGAQNSLEGKEIPSDVEDGILTAKDISRMDLRETDLVVISACQSGLGEVTGDGVFGLQRGFKKAGAQSIVMSLWDVDDEATRIMMTCFYENLAKGKTKYDAFREAQKYLRKYDKGRFDAPEYYAAFVLLDAIR